MRVRACDAMETVSSNAVRHACFATTPLAGETQSSFPSLCLADTERTRGSAQIRNALPVARQVSRCAGPLRYFFLDSSLQSPPSSPLPPRLLSRDGLVKAAPGDRQTSSHAAGPWAWPQVVHGRILRVKHIIGMVSSSSAMRLCRYFLGATLAALIHGLEWLWPSPAGCWPEAFQGSCRSSFLGDADFNVKSHHPLSWLMCSGERTWVGGLAGDGLCL